ncbi:hypothetical protein BY458DRAFT_516859 [Sporodiniella umbellata]|nr:hypothetical protein BY458DRAFT_516859 [Sporodiniella umbellata]
MERVVTFDSGATRRARFEASVSVGGVRVQLMLRCPLTPHVKQVRVSAGLSGQWSRLCPIALQ